MHTSPPSGRPCGLPRNFLRRFLALSLFALGPALIAQPANLPANRGNADGDWQNLVERALPPSAHAPAQAQSAPRSAAAEAQERNDQLAHFLGIAGEAKTFGENNANYTKAAQVLEAKSLLKAAFLGEKSHQTRIAVLVDAIERDQSLPTKDRFEVVALAEHLSLREVAKNSKEARAAREESARYLMQEFPGETGGYSALLGAADTEGDTRKIKAVAQEVIASPAPFAAKAQARILAGRYELIGKSLADVANTALGRGSYFEKARARQVLLYTWATWSTGSITCAKTIAAKAPAGVLVIGYNLDHDVAGARRLAAKEGLPGEQYYNEGGPGSWLALLLKLDSAPLIYLTDARGIIRDVAAQRSDLTVGLTAVAGR